MNISVNVGNQNKIHVLIDGEYTFTVDAEYWYSSPYCSVKSIDNDEESAAFLEAVGSRCAFIAGLRILSYSDHSEREMINKLCQKGHKKECVFSAVDKLREYGYLNDERYASNLAERLMRTKGMSVRGIKTELIHKGISREIAENVTESLDFDPILRIIELLNTKYSRNLSDEKGIKKTVAALQRLGYGWSDIKSALRSVEAGTEDFDDV